MKVVDLQRFLSDLTPFVRAAGASEKVATELTRAVQSLDPFKNKTIEEFNEFLMRADEFDRTGKLTLAAPAKKARVPKAPALSIDDAARIYGELHRRATDPAVSYSDIDATLKPFEKLTVAQLLSVAAKVNVTVPKKGKAEILAELARRIKELKVSNERNQFPFGQTA